MSERRYPTDGRKKFLKILDSADYVECDAFDGPSLGYFCGTCSAFKPDEYGTGGECMLLKNAPVRSFGCCNNWALADEDEWLLSDGTPEFK